LPNNSAPIDILIDGGGADGGGPILSFVLTLTVLPTGQSDGRRQRRARPEVADVCPGRSPKIRLNSFRGSF
jgi:hypothetical protein